MMKITTITISILLILVSFSCAEKEPQPQAQNVPAEHPIPGQQSAPERPRPAVAPAAAMITGVVEEVIQGTSYTYLRIKQDDRDIWVATTRQEVEVGKTVSFAGGLEMKNFPSKELQRTFDSIYFVGNVMDGSTASPAAQGAPHQMKPTLEKQEISVEPAEGGITIGDLFTNKDTHADKTVLIRGQVTKVNRAILEKNWVHLQDGTSGSAGKFDLTITTLEQVNVGDIVTFEGKIVLNKDFGAGYKYDVLMEDARLKTE
jgi:hypothetical protein